MNCFSRKVSQENADQRGRRLFNLPLLGGTDRSQGLLGSRSHSEKALFRMQLMWVFTEEQTLSQAHLRQD